VTSFHDGDGLPIETEPVFGLSTTTGGQGTSGRVEWTGDKTYEIHDSGSKSQYDDGMQRDNTAGKPRFDLIFPRDIPYEDQLLTRVAMQYAVGGDKYGDRNWEKSSSEKSLAHHEAALMRHVVKFLTGTEDGEDHAAAIVWNTNAVDLTRRNIKKNTTPEAGGAGGGDTVDKSIEFRPYNPSTGKYEASDPPGYWQDRFKVENGAAKLDPLVMDDLVFEDGDTLTDSLNDTWRYHASNDAWTCADDDLDDASSLQDILQCWPPLTLISGPRPGCKINKDGKVTGA
jgi:hypothetical protein